MQTLEEATKMELIRPATAMRDLAHLEAGSDQKAFGAYHSAIEQVGSR